MRRVFLAAVLLVAGLRGAHAAMCPGYTRCPAIDYGAVAQSAAAQAQDAAIDAVRQDAVRAALVRGIPFDQLVAQIGRAIVFDRRLSANGHQACAQCHTPAAGFAGGLAAFRAGGGVVPGAQPWRTGFRNPQSLAYAAFIPNLKFDADLQNFTGGAFWDMRATGAITGSAAGDQALTPLTSPFEMGLADSACAIWRLQYTEYAKVFAAIWGRSTFAVTWPAGTARSCTTPSNGKTAGLALDPAARAQANRSVDFLAQTILAYEESALASPFSSKFDQVLAGTAQFSNAEAAGYALFNGAAHCSQCHSLGGARPLVTNFTAANLGVPRNASLAYLHENRADRDGYVANPVGPRFADRGVGGFLASAADTNPQWQAVAAQFDGWFATPSLRNVAAGTRAYMHNGYFKSLRAVVHFLNTRDVLGRCADGKGVGVSCWPAPEFPAGMSQAVGHLGLSDAQEVQLTAFLRTLSDGGTAAAGAGRKEGF